METLLNKGFNFSILPNKLDITQTLVDYRRFERSIIWMEFFHGKEQEESFEIPIFKTYKNNMPKNYSVPEGLKIFLGAVNPKLRTPETETQNNVICPLKK